jgi:signal transduction histidine kinase
MRLRPPRAFWIVLDWLAAGFCWVVVFGMVLTAPGPRHAAHLVSGRGLLAALLALGLAAPVAFRRRAPARALAAVLAVCIVTLAVGGDLIRGAFLPLAMVLYGAASTARRAVAAAGLAIALILLLAVQGIELHFEGVGSGNAVAVSLTLTIVWVVGYSVQQRRTYMAQVRDRAASDAVTRERLRIARELHDVVAHSMTVVAVQAGYGEYVFDSQPAQARAALGAIQAVSREALGEMQRLLGVLRQTAPAGPPAAAVGPAALAAPSPGTALARPAPRDGVTAPVTAPGAAGTDGAAPVARERVPAVSAQPPLAPVPGLANLDRLIERTAGAGVRVTVQHTGQPRSVPASLDLSAYRIVQEALTNVVKHSGAATCRVLVDYGDDALRIQVTDDGPGAGPGTAPAPAAGPARLAPALPRAGHGLLGMRERVSLAGGEFSAAPRPGGGFQVRAQLPLPAAR